MTLLANAHVVIYGLGLMGGSLAMALRGKTGSITAIDPDETMGNLALTNGVVDTYLPAPPAHGLPADLVVLAAPVLTNLELLLHLPDAHPGQLVVIDLSSTKSSIMAGMAALPERFAAIGGHPMCGKELSSFIHADATIFRNAPFVLVPAPANPPEARAMALELTTAIGSRPLWMDAETHDLWVAHTSHIPYLVSNLLAAITPLEAATLVGPGFRSTARLASSNRTMMLDILNTNRKFILAGLHDYGARLSQLASLLESFDRTALDKFLADGAERKMALIPPEE